MTLDPAVAATRLAVRTTLADLEPGSVVLVACSGGADSLALLAATVFEGSSAAWYVIGATVDHGLQEGSAAHADQVVAQMSAIGAAETVTATVHVEAGGLGPEAAARRARHAVLEEMAGRFGAAAVLLGHTRDDQAETVLLGLARGSGGRSITGMRPAYDAVRRPFLGVTRAQTLQACAAQGIEPWDDPHNHDDRFARVRVRERVLPVLERELGPGVAAALARTGDLLRRDLDTLDDLADALAGAATTADGIDLGVLADQPDALVSRVLRGAALAAGAPAAELFAVHVDALLELARGRLRGAGGGQVQLPGGVTAHRAADRLLFTATPVAP
ncbi:tRNA lysidine(34) synthetase TilS [Nocardioides taihuensis]|uniref:tRNA(Ile)-lysidine synthase n=1 Tax=Nocardioides taihuensis TaxID=1835606 RepID=A0ABW0BHA6_9ACTN